MIIAQRRHRRPAQALTLQKHEVLANLVAAPIFSDLLSWCVRSEASGYLGAYGKRIRDFVLFFVFEHIFKILKLLPLFSRGFPREKGVPSYPGRGKQ